MLNQMVRRKQALRYWHCFGCCTLKNNQACYFYNKKAFHLFTRDERLYFRGTTQIHAALKRYALLQIRIIKSMMLYPSILTAGPRLHLLFINFSQLLQGEFTSDQTIAFHHTTILCEFLQTLLFLCNAFFV